MFPICRDKPINKEHNLHTQNKLDFKDSPIESRKKELNGRLHRICREECEMLENELCRKEYAIAKRHPQIGLQVPLVECSDLPLNDTEEAIDCLSLGISKEINIHKGKYQEHLLVFFYCCDHRFKY